MHQYLATLAPGTAPRTLPENSPIRQRHASVRRPLPETLPSQLIRAADLPSSGLPLGGIGTGGIELWADGIFRAPNFTNPGPWAHGYTYQFETGLAPAPAYDVEDQFFILRVKTPSLGVQMRFLFVGQGTAFNSWGHMARGYKYARIPTVQAIEHEQVFPFTCLRFIDDALPVSIELTAWAPFVPHDVDSSSLPGAWLDFTVTNHCQEPAEVSILHSVTNLAGWEKQDPAQVHALVDIGAGACGTIMRGGSGDEATTGDMTVFAIAGPGQRHARMEANPWLENIIWPFMQEGDVDGALHMERLARVEYIKRNARDEAIAQRQVSSPALHRNRCFQSLRETIEPGSQAAFHFGFTWHFPHHRDRHGHFVGKAYGVRFADSAPVAAHMVASRTDHLGRSARWPELVINSALPSAFALSLLDQLSTLVKSTWLTAAGDYLIWEGLGHASSNTVDVEHYGSFALALLFPSLRSRVVRQCIAAQRSADGQIAHGFQSNLRVADIPKFEYLRWDVNAQFVLAAYRDWRWSGDATLLLEAYPGVIAAVGRLAREDKLDIGLPWTDGHITYDHWNLAGIVTYVAVLHLAALQAAAAMALAMGDEAQAHSLTSAWERGRDAAETLLWDNSAKKYSLAHRSPAPDTAVPQPGGTDAEANIFATQYGVNQADPRRSVDHGVQTDALNGDVFAALTGLPPALDAKRRRAMTALAWRNNRHVDARFIANGACDDDAFPDQWPLAQWHNPWTGIEYFFAAQLFQEGMIVEGLSVIDDVFIRTCDAGLRFNHPECGNHYSRALSIYAAYVAYSGIEYDAVVQSMLLHPADPEFFGDMPVLTAGMLGRLEITPSAWTLSILSGHAAVKDLRMTEHRSVTEIRLNGISLEFTHASGSSWSYRGSSLIILADAVELSVGQSLIIHLS